MLSHLLFSTFNFCVFYYLVVVIAPSVDVSRCKRPLVLNVANTSRETTPFLRSPHSDLGAVLNEGFLCTALKKMFIKGKTKLMFGSYGINRVNKK